MKALELRKKSEAELHKQIDGWREKITTMIRERRVTEVKNVRELRALRKDIARALTILSEKKRQEG